MQEHKKKYCVISIFGELFMESWQVHWIILSEWLISTKVKHSMNVWPPDQSVHSVYSPDQWWPSHLSRASIVWLNITMIRRPQAARAQHGVRSWDDQPWANRENRMERINLGSSYPALLKHFIKIVTIYFAWQLHMLMLHPRWKNFPLLWFWVFSRCLLACIGGSIFVIKLSEMLAELWPDNLYVYQVIITLEIGNCPPPVCCYTPTGWLVFSVMLLAFR